MGTVQCKEEKHPDFHTKQNLSKYREVQLPLWGQKNGGWKRFHFSTGTFWDFKLHPNP